MASFPHNLRLSQVFGNFSIARLDPKAPISPLTASEISIFAFSTFDMVYLMVKKEKLQMGKQVLTEAGFEISEEDQ